MGVVYLANDGHQSCAVKVIRPDLAGDPTFRSRFRREVAAASRVSGSHVARVLDADPDADLPWMASELVDGASLDELVREHGPLGSAGLLALAAGLSDGLAAIHDAGVVHRDLKPSNVVMAPNGPRIVDFGIAQAASATTITATGIIMGSPGFMAPEQAQGQDVSAATDVFAFGALLIFAATGRSPFGEGMSVDVLYRVVHDEVEVSDVIPDPLRSLVRAALAKDPSQRPTAHAITDVLTRSADPNATVLTIPTITGADSNATSVSPKPAIAPSRGRRGRRSRRTDVIFIATAAAILALAGAVAAFGLHGRSHNTAAHGRTRPTTPSPTTAAARAAAVVHHPATTTTASPTTLPATTTTTGAPQMDLSGFVGSWFGHHIGFGILPDGSGSGTWMTDRWCSTDPGPGCDAMAPDGTITPGGSGDLQVTEVQGDVAFATVLRSTDPALPTGPIELALLPGDMIQVGSLGTLCGPNAAQFACGQG